MNFYCCLCFLVTTMMHLVALRCKEQYGKNITRKIFTRTFLVSFLRMENFDLFIYDGELWEYIEFKSGILADEWFMLNLINYSISVKAVDIFATTFLYRHKFKCNLLFWFLDINIKIMLSFWNNVRKNALLELLGS